ncbi:hypothetical protein AAFF_G00425890 [Aldrovandia affinis]|uniref:Uncharacterized protein n=1 Tax=Aldrovandia affinis TaxID=143900 RepID=A0AAD7T721_9TELE|nr:hypothetical protein AAFF_G00425890 [Aldrovandia affinis]
MLGLRTAPKEDLQSSSAELVYGQPLRVPGEFMPNTTDPWSAAVQRASLLDSARVFAPVPTTQHGVPRPRCPQACDRRVMCSSATTRTVAHCSPRTTARSGSWSTGPSTWWWTSAVGLSMFQWTVKLAHLDVTQPVDLAIPPGPPPGPACTPR